MSANLMIEYFFILEFVTEIVWSYEFVSIWLIASITPWYIIQYVLFNMYEYLQLP